MRIKFDKFAGIMPILDKRKLPQEAAVIANNLNLRSSRLEPLKETAAATLTGWKAKALEAGVDVALSPVFADQYSRYYWTDGTLPLQVTGTFGTRNVKMNAGATIAATANSPSESSLSSATATAIPWSGAAARNLTVTYGSLSKGASFILRYDGEFIAGRLFSKTNSPLNSSGLLTFPGLSGSPTLPMALSATTIPLSSSGSIYAEMKVGQVIVRKTQIWPPGTPPAGTWTAVFGWEIEVATEFKYVDEERSHYYIMTYVDGTGAEGPPGAVSNMVTKKTGDTATLALGAAPGGTITAKRIYRTAQGDRLDSIANYMASMYAGVAGFDAPTDNFYFLAEVAAATTSYTDNKKDQDLAEALGVYGNPVDGMKGLVLFPGGFFAAFKGKDVYFSEPFLANVWPVKYVLTTEYDVVGLAVNGNDLVILTKGNPFLVTGYHPAEMRMTKLPFPQSCSSKESIVVGRGSVFYASPDGIASINGMSATLITEQFYSRVEWQALAPTGMKFAIHDDMLVVFHATGGLIYNFGQGMATMTQHSETLVNKALSDIETDKLYLGKTAGNREWEGSATNRTMTWRTRDFLMPFPTTWSAARVVAESYPTTNPIELRIYANQVLVHTHEVLSDISFRLPVLRRERSWFFEIVSTVPIDEFAIATSVRELKSWPSGFNAGTPLPPQDARG
jgi:hypothetical protein